MNRIAPFLILLLLALASCQKYSDEDYEGMWQLTEIAQPDGSDARDVKSSGVYWRMQLGLLLITHTGIPADQDPGEVVARVSVSGGTLALTAVYHHLREADIPVTDPADALTLAPLGITAPTETFTIDCLTDSRLVLIGPATRLTFRKY
ncbi:MAG: lipocalin-like domain-containing protein [Bacteroidaceae bacterium]|nr:lipocalin-like domain-containing protein [Bacteroidaceae bacterium]